MEKKEQNKTISVLIPIYNVERYLQECLISVLNQDTSSIEEIVLVDDGSTDSSSEICSSFLRKNPSLFKYYKKQNGGLISARRFGISKAKGDYCMFLDADDILLPNAFSTLSASLSNNHYPDIIMFNLKYLNEDGSYCYKYKSPFGKTTVFDTSNKKLFLEKLISSSSLNPIVLKLIKRSLLLDDSTDYSKYYNNSYGEDLLQSLFPVTQAKTILCLENYLYGYRLSNTSMTHNYSPANIEKRYNEPLIKLTLKYMHYWGIDSQKNCDLFYANAYKNIVDTILFFYRKDKMHRKEMIKYSKLFAETNKLLFTLKKSKHLSAKTRFQLSLFCRGHLGLLLVVKALAHLFLRSSF